MNYLAKKRKLEHESEKEKNGREGEEAGMMDVDGEEPSAGAPPKMSVDDAWQKAVAQFS